MKTDYYHYYNYDTLGSVLEEVTLEGLMHLLQLVSVRPMKSDDTSWIKVTLTGPEEVHELFNARHVQYL